MVRSKFQADLKSLVCPLIPSRMKYTCSGRCRGCNPRSASVGAGTESGTGTSARGDDASKDSYIGILTPDRSVE